MDKKQDVEKIEAPFGQKMIQVKIFFWTSKLAQKKGAILPKHAWAAGMVGMQMNKAHDIVPQGTVPFHSLMDLTSVIEKVLIAHGVTLHADKKMKKYFHTSKPKEK